MVEWLGRPFVRQFLTSFFILGDIWFLLSSCLDFICQNNNSELSSEQIFMVLLKIA